MKTTHFFNSRKTQVIVVFFLVIVIVILAVYFMGEKTRNDQKLSEKKDLIISWMPAITPTDLDYLMSRDIYAYYGIPGKNYSDLADIRHGSETELTPYLYPNGPVCGYSVSHLGFIEIDLFNEMPVNRTTTDEIYQIIEAHGRAVNQGNTPVLFIRTALVIEDKENLVYP